MGSQGPSTPSARTNVPLFAGGGRFGRLREHSSPVADLPSRKTKRENAMSTVNDSSCITRTAANSRLGVGNLGRFARRFPTSNEGLPTRSLDRKDTRSDQSRLPTPVHYPWINRTNGIMDSTVINPRWINSMLQHLQRIIHEYSDASNSLTSPPDPYHSPDQCLWYYCWTEN
ncbi:Hypothetical protein NTJ_09996 [Nesidiocoris tenuis]|uniref:Uncharacterized protein n=1 Tax=Nesidiocoris tenuis TaxID=355587 RepID=A0ABN7AYF3_9HEMI|nr:Hypothetical protein NTJ_09996 [Nesidiocoris tenuis]